MADFTLKRGDTRPLLMAQLVDIAAGVQTPINLTTATGVKLIMKLQNAPANTTPTVNSACAFVNRTTGTVSYTWTSANTATVGIYNIEFEIAWNDGGVETVPNDNVSGA